MFRQRERAEDGARAGQLACRRIGLFFFFVAVEGDGFASSAMRSAPRQQWLRRAGVRQEIAGLGVWTRAWRELLLERRHPAAPRGSYGRDAQARARTAGRAASLSGGTGEEKGSVWLIPSPWRFWG